MEEIINVTEPARIVFDESKFTLRFSRREDSQVILTLEPKEEDAQTA